MLFIDRLVHYLPAGSFPKYAKIYVVTILWLAKLFNKMH